MGPVAGATMSAPQTASNSSSWDRWLPTIGSIAGSVGGDVLGAVAVPFTGGIVNPWDASTVLSGLGAGTGQAVENGMQGQNPFQMNDLTQAGIGAGSNLLGLGVGKVIGGVGTALSKAGTQAAKTAANQAAADTAAKAYGLIPKNLTQAYDLSGSLSKANELGMGTSPQDLAQQGWGANNALNGRLNTALDGQTISGKDLSKTLTGTFDGKTVPNGLYNEDVQNRLAQTGLSGDVSQNIPAQDLRKATKDIYSQWKMAKPVPNADGVIDPVKNAIYNSMGNLYKNMSDLLYKNEGVDAAVKAMAPDITAEEVGGNQAVADYLNAAIKTGDPSQIKQVLEETGNMGNIGNQGVKASKGIIAGNASENTRDSTAQLIKKGLPFAKAGAGVMGLTDTKQPAWARVLELAPEASSMLEGGKLPSALGDILTNSAKFANVPIAATGSAIGAGAPSPNMALADQYNQQTPQQGGTMNPANNGMGIFASLPGMGGSPQYEAQAMQALMGMTDPYLMGQYGNQAAKEATQAQKAQTVASMLPQLLTEFGQAGGAQGAIPGELSQLTGALSGNEPAKYASQAQGFAQQLSAATGIPEAEVMSLIPQITQNQQVAASNVSQLKNILSSIGAYAPAVAPLAQ